MEKLEKMWKKTQRMEQISWKYNENRKTMNIEERQTMPANYIKYINILQKKKKKDGEK